MHALHNYSFEENVLGMRAPQNTKYIKGSLQERVLQLQFCINLARSQHFLLLTVSRPDYYGHQKEWQTNQQC